MGMTFDEAQGQLTGPGAPFEITTAEVNGRSTKVFAHAPGSLADLVDSTRTRGDRTFCVYEDERWGFDEWIAKVDAFGAALVDRYGVRKGDRVAIAMRNYPEWTVAWAATISVGAIAVSLNAWWTADELDFALGDATPSVVVADAERIDRMAASCAARSIALVGVRLDGPPPHGVDAFNEVLVIGSAPRKVSIDPDDDATILYTSGTTGHPKGAVSTHRGVLSAVMAYGARAAIDKLRTSGDEGYSKGRSPYPPAFILIVPLFHVTGGVPVLLSCMSSGIKLVFMYRWDPERALELIERERVTNFVGVPTQSHDLMASPRFGEFDTSSLISVGGGGAPTPKTQVAKVDAAFDNAKPSIGYGLTETNSYGPGNSGADYLSHPTSTGRVVRIVDIEARDPEGNTLETGQTGELWMRGPNLVRGYWNNPQATAEVFVDGWFRTGDIGHVDDEGFVYVSDRAKDMVLRGGENVYCSEVEDALYAHPAVHEAAVFGLPDERLGETVAAAVVLAGHATVSEDDLRAFVAQRLAAFKVPARIDFRREPLPRNAAGKFLKRALRDELSAEGGDRSTG